MTPSNPNGPWPTPPSLIALDKMLQARRPLKPYQITIDHTHTLEVFAHDRADAISFVRRAHQQKFFTKAYKKVTSARVHAGQARRAAAPQATLQG